MQQLPYREAVGILLLDPATGKIFCGKKPDVAGYQPVRGGREPNEDERNTIIRELLEELDLTPDDYDLLWITHVDKYDYDDVNKAPAKFQGKYRGQKVQYCLGVIKNPEKIDIRNAIDREFEDARWMTPAELLEQLKETMPAAKYNMFHSVISLYAEWMHYLVQFHKSNSQTKAMYDNQQSTVPPVPQDEVYIMLEVLNIAKQQELAMDLLQSNASGHNRTGL